MDSGETDRFRQFHHAPLQIGHETDGRVVTLMPVGLLSTAGADQLHNALLMCVADQPTAIVVDLALMRVDQVSALKLFAAVARQAARWSGVPLLLVAGHDLERQLEPGSLGDNVGVHATIRGARAAIPTQPARTLAMIRLPHDLRSAKAGRTHVTQTCERWGYARVTSDAVAVSEELVSNALRYSEDNLIHHMELRHGLLTVAVTDTNPKPAAMKWTADGQLTARGFGLQLVSALSTTWGSSPTTAGGKTVWAVLR